MQTPTKDHRRPLGTRVILQPKSPNHHQQQQTQLGHSTSFTRYRSLTPDDDSTTAVSCHHPGARLQAADSGYSSSLESMLSTSGSCASAENSPSSSHRSHGHRISLLGTSSNLSVQLTPIIEGQELRSFVASASSSFQHSSVELTPSTRNAQQRIAAFHISTPPIGAQSHKRLLATPSADDDDDATAAKSRRLSTHASSMLLGQVTPNKHRARNAGAQRSSPFASGHKPTFIDKLLQLNDVSSPARRQHRDENCENSAPPTPTHQSSSSSAAFHSLMDFSPIVAQHTTATQRRRPHALHRLTSEHSIGRLQSSTPIAGAAAAAKVSANVRRMQLKTQSLSPSKLMQRLMSSCTTAAQQHPHGVRVLQPPIVPALPSSRKIVGPLARSLSAAAPPPPQPPVNPARKLLDFNASTFESLVGPPASVFRSSPTASTLVRQHAVHDLTADDTGFERSSMCLDEEEDAADVVAPMPEAAPTSASMDEAAMKTPARRRLRQNLSIATDADLLLLNSSIVCESPEPRSSTTTASAAGCSSRRITDADRCPSRAQRTPKKMQRSYSMHTAGIADIADPGSASRREQNRILYANLPCTPPKSLTRRRQLKRLGGTSLVRRSPVKRKLYATVAGDENVPMAEAVLVQADHRATILCASRRRPCYAGMNQLDMLGRLETVAPAIDRILRHLSTVDLGHVRQVCKRWQNIVESNHSAALRVERKERRYAVSKENGGVRPASAYAHVQQQPVAAKLRKPFSRCNPPDVHTIAHDRHQQQQQHQQQHHQLLVTAVVHSPPVSPNSRAFRENQALVKTLKKSQRLMKCPRCRRSSVIERCPSSSSSRPPHNVPYSESSPAMRPPHHRQHSLPFTSTKSLDWSSSSSSSSPSSSPDESGPVANEPEFGQCSGTHCGFRFCVQCLCEFDAMHGQPGGSRCVRATLVHTSQPERVARSAYVACSKQSKRNLRRLCSLDA